MCRLKKNFHPVSPLRKHQKSSSATNFSSVSLFHLVLATILRLLFLPCLQVDTPQFHLFRQSTVSGDKQQIKHTSLYVRMLCGILDGPFKETPAEILSMVLRIKCQWGRADFIAVSLNAVSCFLPACIWTGYLINTLYTCYHGNKCSI